MHVMVTMPSVPTPVPVACVLVLVYVQLTTQATPPPCNPGDNLYAPVFTDSEVRKTIPETLPTGASVASLRASDNDTVCNFGTLTYTITGDGSAVTYFQIDQDTGTVSVRTSLTNTSITDFTVRIVAQDGSSPPWIATALLYVTVTRNFVGPVWSSTTYATSILETTPVLENILMVTATDSDAQPPNNEVSYELVGDAIQLYYFEIVSSTGDIRLKRPLTLDTARRNRFDMQVVARDHGSPSLDSTPASVTINVRRNDFPPVFNNEPYTTDLREDASVNDTVFTVNAVDRDLVAPFNTIKFTLIGDDTAPVYFDIRQTDNNNSQIYVKAPVLNDDKTTYIVRVQAADGGIPGESDTTTVRITVNRNLFAPRFDPIDYNITISETQALGLSIFQVTATDRDSKDKIRYSLNSEVIQRDVSIGPVGYFYIDTDTGLITLRRSVLGSGINQFTLGITACDNGYPVRCINTTATISINRDGQSPVWQNTPYTIQIQETHAVSSFVLAVRAVDPDLKPGSQVVYEFVDRPAFFAIDRFSGNITLENSILYYSSVQYNFQVRAYDRLDQPRSVLADVTVFVIRNVNAPVFLLQPYQTTISEYHVVGSGVLNTTAVDLDGDVPLYSFVNPSNQFATGFYIDPRNGIIYLRSSMERTPITLFNVTISASDQRLVSPRSSSTYAEIRVDLDDTPQFTQNQYSQRIEESFTVGTSVTTVQAIDADIEGEIRYGIDGLYPAESFFSIEPQSGVISLQHDIKNEPLQLSRYTLRVFAYDTAHPTRRGSSSVLLNLVRDPNAPRFIPSDQYEATVNVNLPIGGRVENTTAIDLDGDKVTYRVVNTFTNTLKYFYLDPETGDVHVRAPLTSAPENFYNMVIEASDGRGGAANATVTIEINRPRNRNTTFIGQPYNANILVSQPANTYVTRVSATDPDLQGSIEYEAVGVYPAPDFFRLNKTTGEIHVSKNLTTDSLRTSRYTLRVQAYDTAFPNMRASEDVVIFVNLNPSTPVFAEGEYRITIPETYPINSMLLTVNASDADRDSIQYYILQDTEGQTASRYFSLGTTSGIVFTRSNLQAPGTANFFRFAVQAIDNGSPRRISQAYVYVTIERDAGAPIFSQVEYQTNIPENTAVNDTQPVLTIFANDADRKGTVKYVITGDGLGMAFFWMDNGRLYVRRPLTSTSTSRFDMTVAAYDSDFPLNRGTARITVYVDRNVGVPQFTTTQYSAQVFEFTNTGTSVLRVNASDSDGDTVRYGMVLPNDQAQTYFFIDDRTGEIYVRRSLSLNTQSQYVFQVRASDQRDPPRVSDTQVVIQVVRDDQPRFVGTPYFASASETNAVDTVIFDVNAIDDNLRGQLVYEIVGDIPAPSYFKINSTTGVISVRSNLTTVQTRQFTLRVSVYDSEIPSVRNTETVTIGVNVNSNAPKFTLNPYVINISEDKQVGTLVTTVTAVDPDGDRVTYNLEATTNAGSYFFLNGATGDVFLIRSVQNIPTTQFTLPVRAFDRPILTQEDRSQVIINIQKDQFPPEFLGTPYVASGVSEIGSLGTIIYSGVTARDPDLKGSLVYEATGIYPAQTFFGVNRNDGRINITQDLKNDGLGRDSYTLQITVYDSQMPDVRVTETVQINVVRNANNPLFSQSTYTNTILETHQLAVPVININATDQDRDTVIYQLTSDLNGADGLSYFYIVRETGVIYPRRQLLGLGGRTYTMNVRATDSGRPAKSSDVNVNIIITGIQRPSFGSNRFDTTVREDRPVTTNIYTLSASKANIAGTMVYEVQGEGLAPYFFAVNQTTGIVSIRRDLRSGRDAQYTLRVRAYDSEFPTFWVESTLVITVTRNPSSPLIIGGPYVATIQDNAGLGTTVTNLVSAQDADQNDKLTFTITGDARCQETFYMNPDTGVVLLSKNIRVATTPSFTCSIQVTDNGFPTANVDTTTLQVNVGSIQFPQFTQNEYFATVDEKNPISTFVVDVQATKTPPGNMVYEVVGEYPAPTFFGVNNRTGRVTVISDLRPDGNREYKLLVAGYDSLYPDLRSTSTVRITVNRNGFGPEFSPPSVTLELPETTSTTSWSRPINVTDRDSTVTTCEISGTAKSQEFFAVDSRTCLLTLKKNLTADTDRTTRYDITILAKDNGNPARNGTTLVTVNVPRDTAIPIIRNLPASVTIEESAQPTDLVYTLDPFDADQDGNVRCQMTGDWPSSTFFTLDGATGQVRINNSPKLDTVSRAEYKVRVQCYDTAWPLNKAEGVLTINVRRNPAFPVFTNTPYTRSIPDTFPLGNTVLQLSGQDSDGDAVTFSNQGSDTDKSFFYVNPTTGVVVLLKDLRSTDSTSFEFQVQVSDGRGKTGDAIVRITVTKNSGPPVFSNRPYNTRIPVTQPVGTRVLSLSVSDPDRVGTVVCHLEGYEPGQTYFELNNVTHAINVRANLTQNPQPDVNYVLLVKCFDSGNPGEVSYTTATITVDRNLASPRFSPTQYTANINDYDPKGTNVVAVTATDSDPLAPENQIMFSLSDGSRAANDYFTVHPFTGLITVSRRVSEDPTTQNRYIRGCPPLVPMQATLLRLMEWTRRRKSPMGYVSISAGTCFEVPGVSVDHVVDVEGADPSNPICARLVRDQGSEPARG
ncbi:protocadherin Fat 4-like isoform X2 [Haliotis cracherodii]|uniref:protocadherin Fat 4-like isoform X2 n=1 Tax=Haliotis cracherodii TaxID=6455 RepID=UPI0039E9D489